MSSVSAITGANSSTSSSSTAENTTAAVSKEEFLNLLVAQLQNQDPLNPQDPTEFTSQLTQYSMLEQQINTNTALDELSDLQYLNSQIAASNYIGHNAKFYGDDVYVENGTACEIEYILPRDSDETTLKIYDSAGALVRTIDLGDVDTGTHAYTWDGLLKDGSVASDGQYTFEVTAVDSEDKTITVNTGFAGYVSAISYDQGNIYLHVNGEQYPLSDLMSVETQA